MISLKSKLVLLIAPFLCLCSAYLTADPSFDDVVQESHHNSQVAEVKAQQPITNDETLVRKISLDQNYYELNSNLFKLTPVSLSEEDLAPIEQPADFGSGGVVEKAEAWQKIMGKFSEFPTLINSSSEVVNKILSPESFKVLSSELGYQFESEILTLSPLYSSLQIQVYSKIQSMKEDFLKLKAELVSSPNAADSLLDEAKKELLDSLKDIQLSAVEVAQQISSSKELLKQSLKDDQDLSLLNQIAFDQPDAEYQLKYWKQNINHPQNPANWIFDTSTPLAGSDVSLNKKIAYTRVHLSYLKQAKESASNPKLFGEKLEKAVTSRSSDGKKNKFLQNPPQGYKLIVHSIVKDASGKPVGIALAKLKVGEKIVRSIAVVPLPQNDKAQLFHVNIPKSVGRLVGSNGSISNGQKRIPDFGFLQDLLKEIETAIGAQGSANPVTAQSLKEKSYIFYQYCHDDRKTLHSFSRSELEGLLKNIVVIESLHSKLLDQILDGSRSEAELSTAFEIGGSQNALAICASMIAEKYTFDEGAKNQVIGSYSVDTRTARIGNFFSRGTKGKQAVLGANSVMSGHYSIIEMKARDWMKRVTVDLFYEGLNPSSKARGDFSLGPNTDGNRNTNDYHIYVLNPESENYASLLECISELVTFEHDGRTGYYKKPIGLCIPGHEQSFFKSDNGDMVHGTVNGIEGQSKGSIHDLSFSKPAHGRFVIYQEAPGLSWAQPWVDYDESTMIAGMRIREVGQVDKRNFRIILDGSGTMEGVFEKVVEALEEEFNALNDSSLASLPAIHIFGATSLSQFESIAKPLQEKYTNRYFRTDQAGNMRPEFLAFGRGPLTLKELNQEKPFGPSPIAAGIRSLIESTPDRGGIPNKPWILAIISDFQDTDQFFEVKNWVTYFSRNPVGGETILPLMVNENGGLGINSKPGSLWENLVEIQLISANGIIEKKISASKWITDDKLMSKGDNGIYFFEKAKDGSFREALGKFMEPIKSALVD